MPNDKYQTSTKTSENLISFIIKRVHHKKNMVLKKVPENAQPTNIYKNSAQLMFQTHTILLISITQYHF